MRIMDSDKNYHQMVPSGTLDPDELTCYDLIDSFMKDVFFTKTVGEMQNRMDLFITKWADGSKF